MLTLQIENPTLEKRVFELAQNLKIDINSLLEKLITEKVEEIDHQKWSETELNSIGKIGFHSESFFSSLSQEKQVEAKENSENVK
jgi:post-segregation antitoxin (ccd killing protein)